MQMEQNVGIVWYIVYFCCHLANEGSSPQNDLLAVTRPTESNPGYTTDESTLKITLYINDFDALSDALICCISLKKNKKIKKATRPDIYSNVYELPLSHARFFEIPSSFTQLFKHTRLYLFRGNTKNEQTTILLLVSTVKTVLWRNIFSLMFNKLKNLK